MTVFPEMRPLRSISNEKQLRDPIMWPSGAKIPTRAYGSHFRTLSHNINFNAVDFLLKEKKKNPQKFDDFEARYNTFEEIIIERVKKLQD